MSRIRSVHPGLWTDERFVSVQPIARLFFMGIWNECDDQGVFEWSPLKLKMRLLPADNADASLMLDELEAAGCILRFSVAGKAYGVVRNFTRYQRPKKPNSVHPITPPATAFAAGNSEEVPNQLPTDGEIVPQMEDGEKEGEPPLVPPPEKPAKGKHLLPADWQLPSVAELTPKAMACAQQWTADSYATHGEGFINYWRSSKRMNADWRLTWANRVIQLHSQVMRDQKFGNAAPAMNGHKPMTAEELKRGIRRAEDNDDPDRAAQLKAELAALQPAARPPPVSADPKVANLIAGATDKMRLTH